MYLLTIINAEYAMKEGESKSVERIMYVLSFPMGILQIRHKATEKITVLHLQ